MTTYSTTSRLDPVHSVIFPFKVLVPAVIGLVASTADPILGTGVLSTVVGTMLGDFDSSYLVAIAIYLVNVGLAIEVGKAWADKVTAPSSATTHRNIAIAGAIIWLLMGVAMAVMRAFETVLTGGDMSDDQADWVIALLLLVLHFGSGLCVAAATYGYLTSVWHQVHPVLSKARKSLMQAGRAVGYFTQSVAALRKNALQAALFTADRDASLVRLRNAEAQTKDQLRVLLAAQLADPAESGLLSTPHKATNADERAASIRVTSARHDNNEGR